jgi:hypothetical protein
MSQSGSDATDTTTTLNYSDSSGSSLSEQLSYQVLPQEFTTFRTGGPQNKFIVEALIFTPGTMWYATGTNYIRVSFRQSR